MTDGTCWRSGSRTDRAHLEAVAYRMLGSRTEADDAVQEAWLRLARNGADGVDNLRGWLTTVVARVCLDMLRSRTSRREEPLAARRARRRRAGPGGGGGAGRFRRGGAARRARHARARRALAFVLHDLFAVPFDEIGAIVGRSPAAARQLASRARRRVQGAGAGEADDEGAQRPSAEEGRRWEVVSAFLAASREGDFAALMALLDPDATARADAAAVVAGAEAEVRGAAAVATTFAGRAKAARLALLDGAPGLVWTHRGEPRMVFAFTVVDGRVIGIELIADAARLGG